MNAYQSATVPSSNARALYDLLDHYDRMQQIKLFRMVTGYGLKEATQAVDYLRGVKQDITWPGKVSDAFTVGGQSVITDEARWFVKGFLAFGGLNTALERAIYVRDRYDDLVLVADARDLISIVYYEGEETS